jgi:hypothetical protein
VSNLVIGVLGVLAVAATGALLKWGDQAFAAIRAAVTPDHRALYGAPAWGLMAVQSDGPSRIRLVIACAPSRSLRWTSFSPDAAIRFIHRQFPSQFPIQPALSDVRTGVKFTVSPTGSTEDGYAWVWITGRADLSTYIRLEPTDGRYIVPVAAILEPIAEMAEAIASPAYREVFSSRGRMVARRFDWFIGVAGEVLRGDGCIVPWDDLDFPGRRPQRAGAQQYPYCPPGGFARDRLRGWNPHRPIRDLLEAFLEDFLQTNGYHDIKAAITDTLAAFAANREMPDKVDPPRAPELVVESEQADAG